MSASLLALRKLWLRQENGFLIKTSIDVQSLVEKPEFTYYLAVHQTISKSYILRKKYEDLIELKTPLDGNGGLNINDALWVSKGR